MSSTNRKPVIKRETFYSIEATYPEGAIVGRSKHVLGRYVDRECRELRGLAEPGYKIRFDIREEGITAADLERLAKVKSFSVRIGEDEVSLLDFPARGQSGWVSVEGGVKKYDSFVVKKFTRPRQKSSCRD